MSTPSLLQRTAADDVAAMKECLDAYGGLVWSLARRLLVPGADVEDAVQEVFIEIWRSAGRFDPSMGSEVTFVATIHRSRRPFSALPTTSSLCPSP